MKVNKKQSKLSIGKYPQAHPQPINNPEIPEVKDWWSDLCKSYNEKNFWTKNQNKSNK